MVKGFPVEDYLDGASNYGSWKPRVLLYLEENKVKDFSLTTMPVPDDAIQIVAWKWNDVKVRKILMDSMKNHLISHLAKLETAKEMFDSLKKLFKHDSASGLIALRTQLHTIMRNMSKSIASYFMRIANLRDQLGDIGETVLEREISTYILRGLPNSWDSFILTVSGHSTMPKYERLWDDCSEEEARLVAKHGNTYHENQALAARSNHQKGKKKFDMRDFYRRDRDDRRYDRLISSSNRDRRDYLKVKCFGCKELGHFRQDFPKEKGKQRASRVEIDNEPLSKNSRDEHSSDLEFLLLSYLSGIFQTSRDTLLIDSGASRHMTGYGDHLADMVQREVQEKVFLGDDARYVVKGVGAISFQ